MRRPHIRELGKQIFYRWKGHAGEASSFTQAYAGHEPHIAPLVAWYRAFETGELPPSLGNNYLDLACSQKGCCRHRSYAFAITAMAVGIPVRYVENELHVLAALPIVGPEMARDMEGPALAVEQGGSQLAFERAKGDRLDPRLAGIADALDLTMDARA